MSGMPVTAPTTTQALSQDAVPTKHRHPDTADRRPDDFTTWHRTI